MSTIVRRKLVINREIEIAVDKRFEVIGSGPVVGFHIRKGDRQSDFKETRNFLYNGDVKQFMLCSVFASVPDASIFIASDSSNAKYSLVKEYPNRRIIVFNVTAEHTYSAVRNEWGRQRLQTMFVDMMTLARCTFIVGTYKSSFSTLAAAFQGHIPFYVTREWMQEVMGEQFPDEEEAFQNALQNGVVLCQLANKIRPNSIKRINQGPVFLERENVGAFISFARSIGCPEMDLFCVNDLYELRDFKKVCMCILSVGRYSAKVDEFEGPYFIGGKITYNREGCMCILSVGRYSAKVDEFEGPYFIGGKITYNREGEVENVVINTSVDNPICPTCGKPVLFTERLTALGQVYHKLCFKCVNCGVIIGGGDYCDHNNKPLCPQCYEQLYGTRPNKAEYSAKGN
ncbi:LIM-type zinc finger-containing protein [Blastocystis sp. ATCC 50177/Nand II]|uniref:LIM-type zinc finger-containing protein n=1 Tax=Blastocystis sp. subtype 1 (strain ATCC 50177 / NandII) TaxID=478820 RepID=A0A196SFC2_BLAHN|nr:LIM-type zinc finger-containing protein [Blastocystis sp. ATCC 50177/Nand II]